MKRVLRNSGLWVVLGAAILFGSRSEAGTINVACPGQSLQVAVDAAQPGDTIQVSGGCPENVLVRNEKQRIAIQGTGFLPNVNGPDATQPTINVRGKGIVIQGLGVFGGKSGIHVNRGSNAVINQVAVSSTQYGIRVDQQSFAVITDSSIGGQSYGIFVDESSTVRVGYNLDTDTVAAGNNITGNGTGKVFWGNP